MNNLPQGAAEFINNAINASLNELYKNQNIGQYSNSINQNLGNTIAQAVNTAIIIYTNSNGWNGFMNGIHLPSSDYWYSVAFIDQFGNSQIKKGHFSLIRS